MATVKQMAAEQQAEINQEQSLRTELVTVQKKAEIIITNQETYDLAVKDLETVKTWRKRWDAYWSPLKDAAHKSWKGLCDKFNEGDKPAADAEMKIKRALGKWEFEQAEIERKRQEEEQRKAREEAEAKRTEIAAMGEAEGLDDSDIEAMMSEVVEEVAAPVAPTYTRSSSVSFRDCWTAEVLDILALFKAIGAKKFKLNADETAKAKEFFESLFKSRATADKSTLTIPGVRAVNNRVVAGRAR